MDAKAEVDQIARSEMNRVPNTVQKLDKPGSAQASRHPQKFSSGSPGTARKDLPPPPTPPPRQTQTPQSSDEAREHLSALLKEVLKGKKPSPIVQKRFQPQAPLLQPPPIPKRSSPLSQAPTDPNQAPLIPPPPSHPSHQHQSTTAVPRPVVSQQPVQPALAKPSPLPQRVKGPPMRQPLAPQSNADVMNTPNETANGSPPSPVPKPKSELTPVTSSTSPNTAVNGGPPSPVPKPKSLPSPVTKPKSSNPPIIPPPPESSRKPKKSSGTFSVSRSAAVNQPPSPHEEGPKRRNRSSVMGGRNRQESVKNRSSESQFQDSFISCDDVDDDAFEIVSGNDYGVRKYATGQLAESCMEESERIRQSKDLPGMIEGFPKGKRNSVVHEIYKSEYTYVQGLEVLIDVFKRPLIANQIITYSEIDSIFANVETILQLNLGVLGALNARLSNWSDDACIGDIFVSKFSHNNRIYAVYCNNYDSAEQVVSRMKRKKDFESFLGQALSDPRVKSGLHLMSYLITPVQRIPRYILLLRDLLAETPEARSDYVQLQSALEIMTELAEYIDEQIKESQSKEKLRLLQHRVSGLMDITSDKTRVLIKEGKVFLNSISKLYRCLLFNDLLVFALGDTSKSSVELQLPLDAVWIADLQDLDPATSSNDAVDLYSPSRPYTIYTKKSNEKKLWLHAFKDAIFNHLQSTEKIVNPNPSDKETSCRTAAHGYPDGSVYEGKYWDGRRHGYGIMKLPNKTVYKGEWVEDERCGEGELQYNTGEVYRGGWLNDMQHGYGELRYCNDDIYEGLWVNGVKHGEGRIRYSNQDMFEGTFVLGRIEGHGRLVCVSGMTYEGMWEKSLRHGTGTLVFPNGNTYMGDFKKNSMTGHGVMTYWNQDVYEGEFKNGLRHGHGILKCKDGSVYDGRWERDLRNGHGKLVSWNKSKYDGMWKNDMRHGQGVFTYSNGDIYSGEFENDMINGEGEIKYANGGRYEGAWMFGRYNGQGVRRYANGAAYNGSWKDGLRHGEGEIIYADGTIYKGSWENDQPHGKGSLTRQKDLHYEGEWVYGVRQGQGSESSYEGTYEGEWKNNMRHGQGKEKAVVGTVYEGIWDHNRKTNKGVQKLIFGITNDQIWSVGHLETNPNGDSAVELPHLPRTEI